MKMGNMNEISLEEVTKLEPGQILADSIRQWRSDCQAGQFKIGATTMKGGKLDMEIIGAQINEGEFFGYPLQKWLALLFVDPEGVLSTILFKTESMDQFWELHRQHRLNGESYWAVEFEVVSNGKYAKAITDFRQQHYSPEFIRLIESKLVEKDGK